MLYPHRSRFGLGTFLKDSLLSLFVQKEYQLVPASSSFFLFNLLAISWEHQEGDQDSAWNKGYTIYKLAEPRIFMFLIVSFSPPAIHRSNHSASCNKSISTSLKNCGNPYYSGFILYKLS